MPAQVLPSSARHRPARTFIGGTQVTRVLVVEDEESFSDAISYLLRKEGFEVAVCATGPDALECLRPYGCRPGAA